MSKKKSGEISATVDETNEMRKRLGLRPLDEGKQASTEIEGLPEKKDPNKPDAEEVKKRTAAAKNKREHEELVRGKGLGDILEEEERGQGSASDWIARSRATDGSMKQAAVTKEKEREKERRKEAKDVPKGTKVRHDADHIPEGETIMTLSDSRLLTDKGEIADNPDELSNVRMLDTERARQNDAIKNKKEYDPNVEGADILEKYNEVKTGPKGFVLGGVHGVMEETDPEKRLALLTHISDKRDEEAQAKIAAQYSTEAQQVFRKPPKKGKQRKRKANADKDPENQLPTATPGMEMITPGRQVDAGSDEEDPELYEQLSKQRRLVKRSDAGAVKKGESALEAVSERIAAAEAAPQADAEPPVVKMTAAEQIAMTATTEFCNVVQTPMEKMDTLKHESFRGSTLYKQQATTRRAKASRLGRGQAPADDEPSAMKDDDDNNLAEEALDLSCGSALAYLRARAQIGNDQESHRNRKLDNRPLEMSTVDGDIKLEYRDDYGRVQTPKEAFRAISWKFHGKVPGRKNLERRLLRLESEVKLKTMDPMVQLPTLRALRHVQVADAKPYMVLSGANEK